MSEGIPGTELSDADLERELRHVHEKRHDILVDGTVEQLRNHWLRTAELERAYLERFPDRVKGAADRGERLWRRQRPTHRRSSRRRRSPCTPTGRSSSAATSPC